MGARVTEILQLTARAALRIGWATVSFFAFASCNGATEPPAQPNVLFIVSDTLRADFMGIYGARHDTSPNLDRFARENLIFRRAVSPAPWTSPAVASLFTSLYPSAHGVARDAVRSQIPTDSLNPSYTTLAETFRAGGYATHAIVRNPWLSRRRGYAQGFDKYADADRLRADQPRGTLHTKDLGRIAKTSMLRLAKEEKPFFFYLHVLDPHRPFSAPSEIVDRFHPMGSDRPKKPQGLELLAHEFAHYNAEIFVVDTMVGDLFDFLRAEGLYDDLIIAFASDHGEQFYEHGSLGHGHHVYAEEVHVPFLLKGPGLAGEIQSVVSTLDIGPTLLELAGVDPIPGAQGLALPSNLAERERRGVLAEGTMKKNYKALVTQDGEKLIVEFKGLAIDLVDESAERAIVGLYDWNSDAKEKSPINDEARTRELRERMYGVLAESGGLRSNELQKRVQLDDATIKALQALGYGESVSEDAVQELTP